jgi:hypothetical protein
MPVKRSTPNRTLVTSQILSGVLWTLAITPAALAQDLVSASPDVTIELGLTTQTSADENVAVDNLLGMVLLQNLGTLPRAGDLSCYAKLTDGDDLFCFDTTVELPGPVYAQRGDVVRFDGADFSIEFDASAAGVPAGAVTDAVAETGGLLLSFDTTVDLGGGVTAADEDLVRWDGATFTLIFDGSAAGIDAALDVDAAQHLGGPSWALSFDTSGNVGGIDFDDEDVLEYDGSAWTLGFDGSTQDTDWAGADLDAVFVPEPGQGVMLVAGAVMLSASRRRRSDAS